MSASSARQVSYITNFSLLHHPMQLCLLLEIPRKKKYDNVLLWWYEQREVQVMNVSSHYMRICNSGNAQNLSTQGTYATDTNLLCKRASLRCTSNIEFSIFFQSKQSFFWWFDFHFFLWEDVIQSGWCRLVIHNYLPLCHPVKIIEIWRNHHKVKTDWNSQ